MPDVALASRLLVESLVALSASLSDQVAYLGRHGVHHDELALDFDHAVGVLWILTKDGMIGSDLVARLRQIDELLGEMSGQKNAGRWTDAALADDRGWAEVRRLARDELNGLAQNGVTWPTYDRRQTDRLDQYRKVGHIQIQRHAPSTGKRSGTAKAGVPRHFQPR